MKYSILQKRGQIYQVHYFDGFKVIYHEIVHFTEKDFLSYILHFGGSEVNSIQDDHSRSSFIAPP